MISFRLLGQLRRLADHARQLRRLRSTDRLVGPVGAFFGRDIDAWGKLLGLFAQCRGARGDPAFDGRDLLGRSFLLAGGHFAGFHPFEQQAGRGIARLDGRPAVAAADQEPLEPQIEIAFQRLPAAMTVKAIRFEDRPNILFVAQLVLGLRGDQAERQMGDSQQSNCHEPVKPEIHGRHKIQRGLAVRLVRPGDRVGIRTPGRQARSFHFTRRASGGQHIAPQAAGNWHEADGDQRSSGPPPRLRSASDWRAKGGMQNAKLKMQK